MNASLDAITLLFTRIDDLSRKINNLITVGTVQEVANGRVIVRLGDTLTPPIPYLVSAAGDITIDRRPSIGEQVVVLNLSSGARLENAVALPGLSYQKFPSITQGEALSLQSGNDFATYDPEDNSLVMQFKTMRFIAEEIKFESPKSEFDGSLKANKVSDSNNSIEEIVEIYNQHNHSAQGSAPPTPKIP